MHHHVSVSYTHLDVYKRQCGNSAKEELQAAFPYLTIEDYGTPGGCQHKFKTTVVTNTVSYTHLKFRAW